jgi:hypothetical protein
MRGFWMIVCFLVAVSSSWAQIPQLVNYQGLLADSTGTPVNGSLSMVFSIYDDSTGGVPVWMESHSSVSVIEGRFSVLLGSVNPLGDSTFDESDRYLGLAVNGDPEMQPRARISSTPYTYYSGSVASSSGGSVLLVGSAADTVQVDPYSGYAFRMTNDGGDERLIMEANDPEGSTISIKNPNGRYMTLGSGDSTICIYGMDGNERVIIGMEAGDRIDGGGAVSVYDDSLRLSVSVTKDGVSVFDNSRSDTVAIFGTDGNISAKGWISMGSDSLNAPWSTVLGQNCSAQDTGATVSGGISNHALGYTSTVGGGQSNYVGGDFSAIPGGYADTIANGVEYSYLFGIDSDLSHDSTFMVDMPHIHFGNQTDGYEFPTTDGSGGQVMTTDGNGQLAWANIAGTDADWTISGDNMYSAVTGNVGIGISNPVAKLHVYDFDTGNKAYLASNNYGAIGWNDSTGSYGYLGGISGFGVLGSGSTAGVYGVGPNPGNFATLGSSFYGVYARGDSGYAGYFYGDVQVMQDLMIAGDIRMGVTYPEGRIHAYDSDRGNTGYLVSNDYGVYGHNDSTGSYGYLGGISGYGVMGSGDSAGVYGVGPNPGNFAHLGSSLYGIYASADSGYAGYFDGDAWVDQNLYALGNVGIGTSDPDQSLHIVGSIKIVDGNQGEGYFLVSDSVGVGRWEYWGFPSESEIEELYDIIEQQNSRIARLEKEIADIKSNQR